MDKPNRVTRMRAIYGAVDSKCFQCYNYYPRTPSVGVCELLNGTRWRGEWLGCGKFQEKANIEQENP